MRSKVEVEEKIWETNTYVIEAESEGKARRNILEGNGEGFIELVEEFPDTREVINIRSITPTVEAAEDTLTTK